MGYENKEIERKFIIQNKISRQKAYSILYNNIYYIMNREDYSSDVYWHPVVGTDVDIIRVRNDGVYEFTIKKSLSGDNTNRVEIDTICSNKIYASLNQLFGKPAGKITKNYLVLFLDNKDTSVSIYQVKGDKRLFLEVEARTMSKVNKIHKQLARVFDLKQEYLSLYELFLKK